MESPAPTFHALGIRPPLEDTLRRLGFERPTPIQEKAIPPVLAGRDVVGSAETGSGKTAAYLLPALSRLLAGTREGQTRMLVLVPTRELAQQVHAVVTELAAGTDLACIPVYGGTVMEGQALAMRGGVDIVVATPGRLIDLMGRATTKLDGLKILVLDEADRMLDMGFLPDIKRILARLPSGRQTLLFSATMPPEIVDLARTVLREPERVRIGNPRTTKAPVGITHAIFPVPGHRKTALLEVLLRRGNMASVLVFVRTKGRADQLERELARLGFSCGVLHSDRSQADREAWNGAERGREALGRKGVWRQMKLPRHREQGLCRGRVHRKTRAATWIHADVLREKQVVGIERDPAEAVLAKRREPCRQGLPRKGEVLDVWAFAKKDQANEVQQRVLRRVQVGTKERRRFRGADAGVCAGIEPADR